ncbi:unnamed protein product [Mytilus edulis]|nr:unnamed protein product [Mytilus edulis]
MTADWENKIKQVKVKFDQIDNQCTNAYHSQSGKDIDAYAASNSGQTSSQFAAGLFNLLAGKYYWRHWIVLAYNPISGSNLHYVGVSGGHIKFRKNGRNIVVGSVDKSRAVMGKTQAENNMKGQAETKRVCNFWNRCWYTLKSASEIFNSISRSGSSFFSVVRNSNNANFHYHSSRAKFVQRSYFHLMMWG